MAVHINDLQRSQATPPLTNEKLRATHSIDKRLIPPACLQGPLTWMYFPNRLELSLRTVLALPNASRMGLDSRTCCSIVPSSVDPVLLPRMARYFMMILHVSVFPAPDSPLTRMDFFRSKATQSDSFGGRGRLLLDTK